LGARQALLLTPLIAAGVAIHALWRLELGRLDSAGWGAAGAGMAALILFGSGLGSAWLARAATWRRGIWIAAVAIVLAAILAPARQRAHDDAAFLRAVEARPFIEKYLVWGERHRAEADALIEGWNAEQEATQISSREQQVEAERRRLASTRIDPAVRTFLDAVLLTATRGDAPQIAVAVRDGKISDPAVAAKINNGTIYNGVAFALRRYLPVALVNIAAADTGLATVEVHYQVRPWLVAGAPVTFGDANIVGRGVDTLRSYPAIELVIDLRLVREGVSPVERRVLVHPPERFDARSLALLVDKYGEHEIYREMADGTLARIPPAIEAALASP